jgi:hypothetical protein
MPAERKKYWREGDKWFCETSFWHEDTQNCSTAVVREVAESEVPAKFKPAPAPVETSEPAPPADVLIAAAAPLGETLLPFGDAAAVIGASTAETTETP